MKIVQKGVAFELNSADSVGSVGQPRTKEPRRQMNFYFHPDDDAGDGYRNEFQRSHAHERTHLSIANSEERSKIAAVLADGRFAVVAHSTAFCPVTDGILGVAINLVSHFATRAEAQAFLAELHASDPSPDDTFEIQPMVPAVAVALVAVADDDVPF